MNKVIDGDTFTTEARRKPVRLANVDTPAKGERGYSSAKAALQRLIADREVVVTTKARDKYGRSVANVRIGSRSVNKAMKKHSK